METRLPFTIILFCLAFLRFMEPIARAEPGTISIGGIAILSGENSSYGVQGQRGAEIAVDEINASGGINGKRLQIIWEDESGGLAERAVTAYKKLTQVHGVDYIVGPSFQDGLLALAPMAKREGKMLVSGSTPALNLPHVFSTWIDPHQEADYLAKQMRKRFRKVAILASQQSWEEMVGERFKKTFIQSGGEIIAHFKPLQGTTLLKTEVLKTRAARPDAIFIASYTLFSHYAKELRRQGVDAPLFTIEADNSVVTAAGPAAEGTISIGPALPDTGFIRTYRARYKEEPDVPAHHTYDALMLLAQALRTGEDIEDVQKFFATFSRYEGASGIISNVDGTMSTSMALFEVAGGKLVKKEQ